MSSNAKYKELCLEVSNLKMSKSNFYSELQSGFTIELENEHKKLFPRRKKIKLNNIPSEIVKAIKEKYLEEYKKFIKEIDDRMNDIKLEMDELLKDIEVILQDDYCLLMVSTAHEYRSQTQANKYAEGRLVYHKEILRQNGISCEIRTLEEKPITDTFGHTYQYNAYQLWGKCEPYLLEALFRKCADINKWTDYLWKFGVNPKVYFGG